jgi:hypothetical protein
MAQPKADVVVVPPAAMPEPDIAAELDALAARSSPSPTTTRGAAPVAARPPLVVVGHRGSGMNALAAPPEDPRARGGDVRENTLRSFNAAAAAGVAYVEFDVQVRDRDHSVSHPRLGLARRGRQRPPLTTLVFFKSKSNGGFGLVGLVCTRRTDRGDGAPRVLVLGEPGC